MILFTLLIGYRIPLPGIDTAYLQVIFGYIDGMQIGGFINALTGSSFASMSIFALSVAPYISASILVQLAGIVFPGIERMQKDGSVGKQKIERLTFIVGAVIAAISALSLALTLGKQGLFINYSWYMVLFAVAVWTAGACFLIWVGQTISNKLIGNGVSMIMLFNILSTMPADMVNIYNSCTNDSGIVNSIITIVCMFIVACLIFAYVAVMNSAEKRLPISNSSKAGMRMDGANTNNLPLKLNMGGVMPIIFSSAIMGVPSLLASLFGAEIGTPFYKIAQMFNQTNWFKFDIPLYSIGILFFIIITYLCSYLYAKISFDPYDIADNLRRGGSVLNGIRPGQPTAEYLKREFKSVMNIGTAMLIVIALIPTAISGIFGIGGLSFGGTTIIIIVGVLLELRNTIYAQTSSVAYNSLIRKKRAKR